MSRAPDGCGPILIVGAIVVALLVGNAQFGVWFWVAIAGAIGWFFYTANQEQEKVILERKRAEQERAELERKRAEQTRREQLERACSHGTRGANHNPSLCTLCTTERQQREARAAEEVRRIKVERLVQQSLWREKIRTVEYLRQVAPIEFEQIVLMLYRAMGFLISAEPQPRVAGFATS